MKVRCVKLFDSRGRPADFSPWLTIGEVYHVLSVFVDNDGTRQFRVLTNKSDKGLASMGLYRDLCFEVVSEFRPSNWRERTLKSSAVEISPESWQSEGFWAALYDGDPEAYRIFDRERHLIMSEET